MLINIDHAYPMFEHELILLFISSSFVSFRFRTVEPEAVEDVCEDLSEPEPEDLAAVDLPTADSGKGGYISYLYNFQLACLGIE